MRISQYTLKDGKLIDPIHPTQDPSDLHCRAILDTEDLHQGEALLERNPADRRFGSQFEKFYIYVTDTRVSVRHAMLATAMGFMSEHLPMRKLVIRSNILGAYVAFQTKSHIVYTIIEQD